MLSLFLDFFNPPLKEKKEIYHLALFPNKSVVYGYSIHGLWVDYVEGGYPQYCKKVTYNEDKLQPLMEDMKTYVDTSLKNSNVDIVIRNGKPYYMAIKRIKKGQEILAHYGIGYWLLEMDTDPKMIAIMDRDMGGFGQFYKNKN